MTFTIAFADDHGCPLSGCYWCSADAVGYEGGHPVCEACRELPETIDTTQLLLDLDLAESSPFCSHRTEIQQAARAIRLALQGRLVNHAELAARLSGVIEDCSGKKLGEPADLTVMPTALAEQILALLEARGSLTDNESEPGRNEVASAVE